MGERLMEGDACMGDEERKKKRKGVHREEHKTVVSYGQPSLIGLRMRIAKNVGVGAAT